MHQVVRHMAGRMSCAFCACYIANITSRHLGWLAGSAKRPEAGLCLKLEIGGPHGSDPSLPIGCFGFYAGGAVHLLLGLALMATAAYCLFTFAPPRPDASPSKVDLVDLVECGPASTVAADSNRCTVLPH